MAEQRANKENPPGGEKALYQGRSQREARIPAGLPMARTPESAERQATNAALAALAKGGSAYALAQLWELNKGLLRRMFWKWYPANKALADRHGLTAEDFEQEGFFAVQYAAGQYDPARGAFSTFLAYAMQRQITALLRGEHARRITGEDGHEKTVSANPLNGCASLDEPLTDEEGEGCTRADLLPCPAAQAAFDAAEQRIFTVQLHAALAEALGKLPEREAAVLRARYYSGQTLQAAAAALSVAPQRACQLERSGLAKLRRNPRLLRWHDEVLQSHAWHGTGFAAWEYGGSVEERTVELLEAHGAYR